MDALPVFTPEQSRAVGSMLGHLAPTMLGRKLEEGDWGGIYCEALGLPDPGWSNLDLDVVHSAWAVEHKMLRVSEGSIRDNCGKSLLHPAATRSVRVSEAPKNADAEMTFILEQYGDLLRERQKRACETARVTALELRTGLLLWQSSLASFLYFEQPLEPPDPRDFRAEWHERPTRGRRKGSRNLWIYERETGKKRYSIAMSDHKVQPYYDVPNESDSNVYVWTTREEHVSPGEVQVWLSPDTVKLLSAFGEDVESAIETVLSRLLAGCPPEDAGAYRRDLARPRAISATIDAELFTRSKAFVGEDVPEIVMQRALRSM